MEYNFDIIHCTGVKHQKTDVLCRLPTEQMNNFNINDDISVLVVTTHTQTKVNRVKDNTATKTYIETNESQLPTLGEFISAQGTDDYCEEIRPTVGKPGFSFNFDKSGLLPRQSPIDGSVQKTRAATNSSYNSTFTASFKPCWSSRRAPTVRHLTKEVLLLK